MKSIPRITAVVVASIGAVLLYSAPAKAAAQPLLPGEAVFASGAPSFDFGSTDTINYASPDFDTLPAVQSQVKAAGLTLDRMWAYSSTDTDASILARVQAAQNAGMTCMFMLGDTEDLTWMEHVVSITDNYCKLYEFGNEPDNGGSPANGSIATYTSQWIADVPVLRSEDPSALFGGPVLTWSGSCCQFSGGGYPDDMAYFLGKTAAAGVRADFITYHDYPCTAGKQNTQAACISATQGDFAWNYNNVTQYETQYYGGLIPTGLTEYNFDPGDGNLSAWCGDGTFMSQWTTTAVDAIVKTGMAFATQFDLESDAGYGCYDMFNGTTAKPQFTALAAEVAKNKGTAPTLTCPPDYTGDTNPTGWCEGETGALEQSTSSFTQWYENVYTPWSNGTGSISCPPDFTGDTFGYANYCFGEIGALEGQAPGTMQTWLTSVYDPYAAFYGYTQ